MTDECWVGWAEGFWGGFRVEGQRKVGDGLRKSAGEMTWFGVGLWCGYSETVPTFLPSLVPDDSVPGGTQLGDAG